MGRHLSKNMYLIKILQAYCICQTKDVFNYLIIIPHQNVTIMILSLIQMSIHYNDLIINSNEYYNDLIINSNE